MLQLACRSVPVLFVLDSVGGQRVDNSVHIWAANIVDWVDSGQAIVRCHFVAQVNSFAAQYEKTGNKDAFTAVRHFFDIVTQQHSYATGGMPPLQ